jgi:hypothetical protein
LGNPLIESKWCDGNASIFTLFSSITVSFVSNAGAISLAEYWTDSIQIQYAEFFLKKVKA